MAPIWSAGAKRSGDPALAHPSKHRSRSARVPPGQLAGRTGRDSSRSLTRKPKRRRRWRSVGALHIPRRPPAAAFDSSRFMASIHVQNLEVRPTHEPSPLRGGWPQFGVRGQSAAATPLWLTRPSTTHLCLRVVFASHEPPRPSTASRRDNLARIVWHTEPSHLPNLLSGTVLDPAQESLRRCGDSLRRTRNEANAVRQRQPDIYGHHHDLAAPSPSRNARGPLRPLPAVGHLLEVF